MSLSYKFFTNNLEHNLSLSKVNSIAKIIIPNEIKVDTNKSPSNIEKEKGNKNQNKCPKILTIFIPFKEVKPFLFFIKAIVRICLLSK